MALQDIIDKMINDAQQKVTMLKQDAAAQVAQIRAQGKKAIAYEEELKKGEAEEKAQTIGAQKKTQAALHAQKEILAAKQGLLNEIFQGAQEAFMQLPCEQYKKSILYYIRQGISSEMQEVLFDIRDKDRLGEGFFSQIKAIAAEKKCTQGFHISFDKTGFIQAGCILQGPKMRMDYRVQAILQSVRIELEHEIAKILFQ